MTMEKQPALRMVRLLRIGLIALALVALAVFLVYVGADPAGAGKEWGH
jgi:hypothetical protein